VVIGAALVPTESGAGRCVESVVADWDADAFEASFFGGLVVDPIPDPMFAGAAAAGPLAQDGAMDLGDVGCMVATFPSE
jgi:hypothetical protein